MSLQRTNVECTQLFHVIGSSSPKDTQGADILLWKDRVSSKCCKCSRNARIAKLTYLWNACGLLTNILILVLYDNNVKPYVASSWSSIQTIGFNTWSNAMFSANKVCECIQPQPVMCMIKSLSFNPKKSKERQH